MRQTILVVLALILAAPAARVQEPKQPSKEGEQPAEPAVPPEPPFVIPPEEKERKNPVTATAMSVGEGKRLYATQCAMCHGAAGDGKGELAAAMELALLDYRDPQALAKLTDGELYYIAKTGKGKMPGQEGRMRDRQLWHLVNFIRSLSKKEPRPEEKPAAPPR